MGEKLRQQGDKTATTGDKKTDRREKEKIFFHQLPGLEFKNVTSSGCFVIALLLLMYGKLV